VLVKWWLLAVPQYIIVGFFLGGSHLGWWGGGLIGVLTIFVGVALAFFLTAVNATGAQGAGPATGQPPHPGPDAPWRRFVPVQAAGTRR
jgi:hypothetical protein